MFNILSCYKFPFLNLKIQHKKILSNMNKKKLNKQDYIFRNCQNQTLKKLPGQIDGIDFYIANLENCEVFLYDWIEQV